MSNMKENAPQDRKLKAAWNRWRNLRASPRRSDGLFQSFPDQIKSDDHDIWPLTLKACDGEVKHSAAFSTKIFGHLCNF